jgi:hypothetical protein
MKPRASGAASGKGRPGDIDLNGAIEEFDIPDAGKGRIVRSFRVRRQNEPHGILSVVTGDTRGNPVREEVRWC